MELSIVFGENGGLVTQLALGDRKLFGIAEITRHLDAEDIDLRLSLTANQRYMSQAKLLQKVCDEEILRDRDQELIEIF